MNNKDSGNSQSLRRRIAGAFILMAFILCSFFSFASYVAVEMAEAKLIDHNLDKLTNQIIGQYVSKQAYELPPDVNFYVDEHIPETFRKLPDGIHEIEVDEKEFHVVVRDMHGQRFVLSDDTTDFEDTELLIFAAVTAGFVASMLLSVLLGLVSARRLIAPVTALAEAVERNATPSELPSLDTKNEIGVLARAFAKRTDQLQHFLADEKLFTGDVSHELRTPLTIMLGASELLKVRLAQSPEDLAVAERIRRVAAEASERVSALLLLSQSPETLERTQVSLTHLIEREIERCQQLLGSKPVRIVFEDAGHVWLHTRAELAGIAIGNLLRNACQYTQEGTVKITLSTGRLSIEDNGPGIPENVRERLFERFVRGKENPYVGSGLGLAIVKRVAEHLGWQIAYARPDSGGSRFILSFPSNLNATAVQNDKNLS